MNYEADARVDERMTWRTSQKLRFGFGVLFIALSFLLPLTYYSFNSPSELATNIWIAAGTGLIVAAGIMLAEWVIKYWETKD